MLELPATFRPTIHIDTLWVNVWGCPSRPLQSLLANALARHERHAIALGDASWVAIGEDRGSLILQCSGAKLYLSPEARLDRQQAPWARLHLGAQLLATHGHNLALQRGLAWLSSLGVVHQHALRRVDLCADLPATGPCWDWLARGQVVTRAALRGYSGDGTTSLGDCEVPGQATAHGRAELQGLTCGARGDQDSAHWRLYNKRKHLASRPDLQWLLASWSAAGIPPAAPVWRAEVELGGHRWARHAGSDQLASLEAAPQVWAWATACPPALQSQRRGTEGALRIVEAEGHSLRRRRPTHPWWCLVQHAGGQLYRGEPHRIDRSAAATALWRQAAGCAASALALEQAPPNRWARTVRSRVTRQLAELVPLRAAAHQGAWTND